MAPPFGDENGFAWEEPLVLKQRIVETPPTDYAPEDEDVGLHWIIVSGNDAYRTHRLIRLCYDLVTIFPGTAKTITWINDSKGWLTFDCVEGADGLVAENACARLKALWLKYDGCENVEYAYAPNAMSWSANVFARFPVVLPIENCESRADV